MHSRSLTVALVAFTLLAFEVLLARLYPVFLGSVSAFVAIPVAMVGLGLGATAMHLWPRTLRPEALRWLVPAHWVVTLASLLLGFWLFNDVFNLTHYRNQDPREDALRIAAMLSVFTPIFAVGGVVLSLCFRAGAAHVGRLYALDLVGSALACFAAPTLLHVLDLPVVLTCVLSALGVAAFVNVPAGRRLPVGLGLLAALGLLFTLATRQQVFTERPDPDRLGVRYSNGRTPEELAHRWNEVSRVALVRWTDDRGRTEHRVIHDDGISNVRIRRWRPKRLKKPRPEDLHGIPWQIGLDPDNALVIFAGVGRDMMLLYENAGGELDVTGIELNARVPWLAREGWDLEDFWSRPGVDLRIDEGRAFLERTPETYDLIFVASNGAQYATRTGHSRKFLETKEAMEAYLDRLAPGGVIVFAVQPSSHKIRLLKRIFAERGLGPLEDAIAVVSRRRRHIGEVYTIVLRPDGLDQDARAGLRAAWDTKHNEVLFDPGAEGHPAVTAWVRDPIDPDLELPTDDRPYERRVSFSSFSLFPDDGAFSDIYAVLDWVKVFTLVFFSVVCALLIAVLQAVPREGRRLPLPLTGWFLGSGVAYMLAQIGLMAKLELFMGKPLYSVAVVLAAFLLANGAGSALVERRESSGRPLPTWLPPVAAAVGVPLTLLVVDGALPHLITAPLATRVLLALLAVGPLAMVLGAFYPLGVARAVERGLAPLVPMTFGLATLSSAFGSTLAMVLIINQGFRTVVLESVPLYGLLAVLGAVGLRRG